MNYPRRTDILLGTVTLALTVFFFVPFSLYLLNKEAFFTSPPVVAGTLLAFSFFSFLLLSLPLLLTKGMTRVVALSILAFLTMAVWMQANLLNWDYGLLDGSALRWRLIERRTLIDVSVWVLLLVALMIIGVKKKASFRTAFFVLLFMQSGSILYVWLPIQNASLGTTQNVSITNTDLFVFSREKNIILLVLDAYQSDIFNEYLDNNPDFKDKMPGFTYYPNAIAEHFYTQKSIPTLLTGNRLAPSQFQSSKDFKEHLNDLLMHQSIPALLKKSGYHVGLYPLYAKNMYPPKLFGEIADNYRHANVLLEEGANELNSLMTVCLFRIAPHPFKNLIHGHFLLSPSFEQDRDEFSFDMQNHLRVGIAEPCFKYYHLQGVHGPHIINGVRTDEEDRGSALKIAALVNQMLATFVYKLQEANAYDNSTIFVVADHGLYNDSERVVIKDKPDTNTPPLDAFVKKCRALPLFLHKPANATGGLTITQTPVCLADILPTVLGITGSEVPAALDGISISELQENMPRIRRHFTGESHSQRSVIPDYEFVVSGFAWYDSAWAYTGNLHTYGGIERIPLNNYKTGTLITFGNSGNGQEYLDNNWNSDKNFHWTDSKVASLTLPLANPAENMVLTLEIEPENTDALHLSIYINETKAKTFHVQEKTLLTVAVPFDPTWKDIAATPDNKPADNLWNWAPKVPALSNAYVNIRIQQEESTMKLFSLCLDNTPCTP